MGKSLPLAVALHFTLAPALAMVALGVVNTALAYYVYFRLVDEEGATFASLNNYIAPLIGVIGGAAALATRCILRLCWAGAGVGRRGSHRRIPAASANTFDPRGCEQHSLELMEVEALAPPSSIG